MEAMRVFLPKGQFIISMVSGLLNYDMIKKLMVHFSKMKKHFLWAFVLPFCGDLQDSNFGTG